MKNLIFVVALFTFFQSCTKQELSINSNNKSSSVSSDRDLNQDCSNMGLIHNNAMARALELAQEQKVILGDQFDWDRVYSQVVYPEVIVAFTASQIGISNQEAVSILSDLGFTGDLANDTSIDFRSAYKGKANKMLNDLFAITDIDNLPDDALYHQVYDNYQGIIDEQLLCSSVNVAIHSNQYWHDHHQMWEMLNSTGGNNASFLDCIDDSVTDADITGAGWGGLFGAIAGSVGQAISNCS